MDRHELERVLPGRGLALAALFVVGWLTFGIGFIVILPMMAISTYIGYREVFETK